MTVHVFGIRHHGPGSARSLKRALEQLRPDVVLIEGPPDADALVEWAGHGEMRPPVALLVYAPDAPQHAVYYPFATFSPEWQALHYALGQKIPVRFMDLPQTHQLGAEDTDDAPTEAAPPDPAALLVTEAAPPDPAAFLVTEEAPDQTIPPSDTLATPLPSDPLGWLAHAAGYSDGERWWEHMVEQRRDGTDMFAAILEAMTMLRAAVPDTANLREQQREAWMRQTIRKAEGEGFARIAVVCGAWHGPALAERGPAKPDAVLLKGLPTRKVAATWIPWTHGRLSYASGYGAGVESPGWYAHLWEHDDQIEVRWLTKVARLLRAHDLDASSASVIEAVRAADALAALRDRPRPGLVELNEATLAVLCSGEARPLALIHDHLIVGEVLGDVPDETPQLPLQRDLAREQKRLRFPAEALEKMVDFDLRKPNDLERSQLLHRLILLGVPWGTFIAAGSKTGTFGEQWRVAWQPEYAVQVVEASMWGTDIATAAAAKARYIAETATSLPALTKLIDQVMVANLPAAIPDVMARLQAAAAIATDVSLLMEALPPLVRVLRYGNVRGTAAALVAPVVDGLVARITIGLPPATAALDDAAAEALYTHMNAVNGSLQTLDDAAHLAAWRQAIAVVGEQQSAHGLIAGAAARLLLAARFWDADAAGRKLSLALSRAAQPTVAASWIEGLLRGGGLLLLTDPVLLGVLDSWVMQLPAEQFVAVLPLVRRTFSTFHAPERRNIGASLRRGVAAAPAVAPTVTNARAARVLPLAVQLLGLSMPQEAV